MLQRVLLKNSLLTSVTEVIVNQSRTQNHANRAIYSLVDFGNDLFGRYQMTCTHSMPDRYFGCSCLTAKFLSLHRLLHRCLRIGTGNFAVFGKQRHHLRVDFRAGGQAFFLMQKIGLAGEVPHQATGLSD